MAEDGETLHVYRDFGGRPIDDLALEAAFLESAGRGRASLFFYSWEGPVVILGYGQSTEDVCLEWCRRREIQVLRRLTGGTGVVHRRDLAVSLFLPGEHSWADEIVGLYRKFLEILAPSLNRLGGRVEIKEEPERGSRDRSPICFEDQLADTLAVDGRKVVGCAQARRSGGVLIHAAVSLNLQPEIYAEVFGVEEERVRRALGNALEGEEPIAVADRLAIDFSRVLEMPPVPESLPAPPALRLAEYDKKRWRPLGDR